MFGRYARLTQETRDLVTGKYGKTPAAVNQDLLKDALKQNNMEEAVTCRPADLIPMEWDKMVEEAKANGGDGSEEDTLTYAMFPKVAPKFFKERANGPVKSESFVVAPAAAAPAKENKGGSYTITVNSKSYNVTTGPAGDNMNVTVNGKTYNVAFGAAGAAPVVTTAAPVAAAVSGGTAVTAPVAGTLLKHCVASGSAVKKGDTVIMLESMKMELEVKAPCDGTITFTVQPGSQVTAGQNIASIGGTVSAPVAAPATPAPTASAPVAAAPVSGGTPVTAPVAGTLLKHSVSSGASVKKGDTVIILESMKMELEVKAPCDGTITFAVQPGTQVTVGMALASVSAAATSAPVASAGASVAAAPTGGKPVNAPVAGTLLKYAVSEGDSVTADTTIMYVESMKMELEIKAGAAGKVHFIAATGTQITSGQVIAEIK